MTVARNAIYNLLGMGVPLVLALATIPLYIAQIGNARYGALAIAWLILGYFGFFDMGLGRATTQRVARLHDAPAQKRSDVFWTALIVNFGLGLAGAVALWIGADYYFRHHVEIAAPLRAELLAAVPLLAMAVPVATATGVCSGALQGRAMFLEVNANTALGAALFQTLPLAVAYMHGPDLAWLIGAAVVARALSLGVFFARVRHRMLRGLVARFVRSDARELFAFGGWVTLTALLSPMLVATDRMMIGAMISAAAVTIYAVPFEMVQRTALIPVAITQAMFPKMAAVEAEESRVMSDRAVLVIATIMTPPIVALLFLIEPFLKIWVGADLGSKAAPVAWALLIGYWFNAFSKVPHARLTAMGRPGLVAGGLMVQVPLYITALYFGIAAFGLMAAPWIFTIRCLVDLMILNWLSARSLRFPGPAVLMGVLVTGIGIAMPWLAGTLWWVLGVAAAILVLGLILRAMPREFAPLLERYVPSSLRRLVRYC